MNESYECAFQDRTLYPINELKLCVRQFVMKKTLSERFASTQFLINYPEVSSFIMFWMDDRWIQIFQLEGELVRTVKQ